MKPILSTISFLAAGLCIATLGAVVLMVCAMVRVWQVLTDGGGLDSNDRAW